MRQQELTYGGQPIPNDIPFEDYFAYLSRSVLLPFKSKPTGKWTDEDIYCSKNHEARLIAVLYLEGKPQNEWTNRDLKILDAVRSGSDMITIHNGFPELIEF